MSYSLIWVGIKLSIYVYLFIVVCCYASYSTPSFPWKPTPGQSNFVPAGPWGMCATFGKRSAPGLAFIKNKKKKTANLVKDFKFSSVDDEGQMVTVFPISINRSEISEKFGQLSVPIIWSAVEQELRIRERWWDWWWWIQGGNLSWIPPRQEVSSLVTFCFSCTLTVTIDLPCHTYDVIRLNGVVVLLLPLDMCIVYCKMTFFILQRHN